MSVLGPIHTPRINELCETEERYHEKIISMEKVIEEKTKAAQPITGECREVSTESWTDAAKNEYFTFYIRILLRELMNEKFG